MQPKRRSPRCAKLHYQARRQPAQTGLIVDVRNDPGGLLDQAVKVTSQFLTDGNVLLRADAHDNRTPFPVQPGGLAPSIPLVVLINPGTASSAEIFAGAMQDHQRGQVVGETTFGTGTVLEPFALDDGSELLLGTKQWLTPNGRLIRNQGIKPDIEIKLPLGTDLLSPDEVKTMSLDQINASADTQLAKAIALLGANK
ncbi:MAG: S41 family peptidase [Caldilineaceae bacterium]